MHVVHLPVIAFRRGRSRMSRLSSVYATSSEVTLKPFWESRLGCVIGTDGAVLHVADFAGNPVGPHVAPKVVIRIQGGSVQVN